MIPCLRLGRKFLMAGKSGLNLTHAEPFEQFVSRYGKRRAEIEPMLRKFGPDDLRDWAQGLGIETFVGTFATCLPGGDEGQSVVKSMAETIGCIRSNISSAARWMGNIAAGDGSSERYRIPIPNRSYKSECRMQ